VTVRLLVEYSHPAQVHKFKHVLRRLMDEGHEVLILSRRKDVMTELLDDLGLPHVPLSTARPGLLGMAWELVIREFRTLRVALRFRPDVMLSAHSVAIAHVGWLLRRPVIVHEDTEIATLQQRLYIPFAAKVVTSSVYTKDWGAKQVRIDSLEPLAYLSPRYFVPDARVLERYGITSREPFAVVRYVAWKAAHDVGLPEPSDAERESLLTGLSIAGVRKIFLTTEQPFEPPPEADVIRPDPSDLHHVLAQATICISEGTSVANEAAVLGVPTILVNPLPSGLTSELERYGLMRRVGDLTEAGDVARSLIQDPVTRTRWRQARSTLLSEKADMTEELMSILRLHY
jgi:predicted glycosyltransferase